MVFFTLQVMQNKSGEISGGWLEKKCYGTSMLGVKDSGGRRPLQESMSLYLRLTKKPSINMKDLEFNSVSFVIKI